MVVMLPERSYSANSLLKVNKSNRGYLKSLTSYAYLNYYRTALVYNLYTSNSLFLPGWLSEATTAFFFIILK